MKMVPTDVCIYVNNSYKIQMFREMSAISPSHFGSGRNEQISGALQAVNKIIECFHMT